jgi:hypothetical protein
MTRSGLALLGGWWLAGCGHGATAQVPQAVMNAALNTGVALIASGVQRARGGCYAVCIDGTVCNPDNGLCERRTCARGCGASQFCNRSFETPVCEERVSPDLPPPLTPPQRPGNTSPNAAPPNGVL